MIKINDNKKIKINYQNFPCDNCNKKNKCVMACYAIKIYCDYQLKHTEVKKSW